MHPQFLWVFPLLVSVGAAFFVWGAYRTGAQLTTTVIITVIVSLVLGGAAGWYRARSLHLHRDPETGFIMMRMSIEGLIFLVVLMAVRTAIRKLGGGDQFGAVADGLMAFVVGLLITRALVIWQRCRALPPHQPREVRV
jgi:hypothetical protein